MPGTASEWESTGATADLTTIARTAEDLGFDYLTCADHVGIPPETAAERGGTYWDPLATLSYLAACTTRIDLVTSVLVLPYHHPLAVVKSYGTLDRLSGGRVILGVGVGSLRPEFDLLGADWANRGAVTDERMRIIREAWGRPEYADMVLSPGPVSEDVALWVGGRSRASLRRAVTLGDGWMPFGLPADTIATWLAEAEAPAGFDVVLPTGRPLDPLGDPAAAIRRLHRLRAAGATAITCAVVADDPDHHCRQLAALAAIRRDELEET